MPEAAVKFQLIGAREVQAAGMPDLEEQIETLERAVSAQPGLAFDLSKTLVESVCKTILVSRKIDVSGTWDLPDLMAEVRKVVRFLPPSVMADKEAAGRIKKTLGAMQTLLQGLCELRNNHGLASHGSDGTRTKLDSAHAVLAARAADALVHFLFHAHREYAKENPETGRLTSQTDLRYDDNVQFNGYVDDLHEATKVFDGSYAASEILFTLDLDAYRNYLSSFKPTSLLDDIAAALEAGEKQ